MPSALPDLDQLRPAGTKRSSKRDLIVNVFLRQEGHLSADDLETVTASLVDLCDLIVRQCEDVRHLLATAAPQPAVESTIEEGRLEALVPSRGAEN